MRYLPLISSLTIVVCAGCVGSSTKPTAFTPAELSERTVGMRAPYEPSPASSFQRVDGVDPYTQPPTFRPSGGIVMGETHASRKVPTTFVRANGNTPAARSILYYTDAQAAAALPEGHRLPRAADGARAEVTGGYVALNIRERLHGALPLVSSGGMNYVAVGAGHEDFFNLHNATNQPVEVVLAVNGRTATKGTLLSYADRGYVVDPGETVSTQASLGMGRGEITMLVFLPAATH